MMDLQPHLEWALRHLFHSSAFIVLFLGLFNWHIGSINTSLLYSCPVFPDRASDSVVGTESRHRRGTSGRTTERPPAPHPIDKSHSLDALSRGICIASNLPVWTWTSPQRARIAHRAASSDLSFSEPSLPPVPPRRAADGWWDKMRRSACFTLGIPRLGC
jgi:hypothetical protein